MRWVRARAVREPLRQPLRKRVNVSPLLESVRSPVGRLGHSAIAKPGMGPHFMGFLNNVNVWG